MARVDVPALPPVSQDDLLVIFSCHGDIPGTFSVSRWWHGGQSRSWAEHILGGESICVEGEKGDTGLDIRGGC